MTDMSRKFLAVSDETEECIGAMLFAGMRAKAVGAGVVVLRCARVPGLGGWVGLDKDISQDAIDSARLKAIQHVDIIESKVGIKAEIVISEDEPVDAIRALVKKDLAIKTLILAAATGFRPGPLVSRLAKGKPVANRPIAVTVIPGNLTDDQLKEIGGMPG
ncbi:MAG: universal stress protein [Hyphomonadaceae bacterium]